MGVSLNGNKVLPYGVRSGVSRYSGVSAENLREGIGGPDASGTGAGILRVLMVENHSDTRQGVCTFLKLLGHEVSCAENVATTLALAESQHFDVLLSDISLPDGDGWNLLSQLEARDIRPAHAIAMSGLGSTADRMRSREAGFEMHLVKPFAPETLAEALGRLAGQKPGDARIHPLRGRVRARTGSKKCTTASANNSSPPR